MTDYLTRGEWWSIALIAVLLGVGFLGLYLRIKSRGNPRVTLAMIMAGIAGLLGIVLAVLLRKKGATEDPEGVTDPALLPRIVGDKAKEQIITRYELDREAIIKTSTDPETGPSLADLANADSAKRLRKTTQDGE